MDGNRFKSMIGPNQFSISGYDLGFQTDRKPFMLPDKAFPVLENAYVFRDRVVKRNGLELLGRLKRNQTGLAFGNFDGAGGFSDNIITFFSLESTAEIEPGSVILVTAANTYRDINPITLNPPNGVLFGQGGNARGFVNYVTGEIQITNPFAPSAGQAATITFSYFPSLPVMGIWQREIPTINDEETVFFDTKYAYKFVGTSFQEFSPGTTWNATDKDFFWSTNWRGVDANSQIFFTTNFICDANNPIRFTGGGAWTDFTPYLSRATPPNPIVDTQLFQARILIPYYGRLLALNTFEGTEAGSFGAAQNFFNRCRFSQIGDPTDVNAWRSDIFGKGGFIDAPTSEQITSAIFFKNTLIVFFERTTWQLRFVGDYGLPFIWERISSDFGSESTFSNILFDQGVASIGDRAIISANAVTVDRIDLQIPDFVFNFRNSLNGPERVNGIRDFGKELVYWTYNEFNSDSELEKFPNKVLIYNYRNNTYALFRDNVTFFGTFQSSTSVTWDSETIFWDDEGITWDDIENQSLYPSIVSGNQEGFVHFYNRNTPDESSLSITAVDLSVSPIQLTILNHNLDDGETVYITNLLFLDASFNPVSTDLNDKIYNVIFIDEDTIALAKWSETLDPPNNEIDPPQYVTDFTFTPSAADTYIGGGSLALFPRLNVQTKDFNPYFQKGIQLKLCYVDFLMQATSSALMTVNIFADTQTGDPSVRSNILVGNKESETFLTPPFYQSPSSDIAWHRFYSTLSAQFMRIQLTYDDTLMNLIETHRQAWELNAMTMYLRKGGKLIF